MKFKVVWWAATSLIVVSKACSDFIFFSLFFPGHLLVCWPARVAVFDDSLFCHVPDCEQGAMRWRVGFHLHHKQRPVFVTFLLLCCRGGIFSDVNFGDPVTVTWWDNC